MIERVCIFTWRPRSGQLGDAPGGRNRGSLVMHFEAVSEQVWSCTCRPQSSEIGDAHGGSRSGGSISGERRGGMLRLYSLVKLKIVAM